MKKIICILLLALLTINANSQIEKGSKMLTLNGMCSSINTTNGVYKNSLDENAKSLSLGASYSFVQKKFLFGFGLDFAIGQNKQLFRTEILNKYEQSEYDVVISSLILPTIHAGYYQRIFDKLYFTTNLKVGVGAAFYNLASTSALYDVDAALFSSAGTKIDESVVVATADLKPEFTYFFSKKIGISLYTGGLEYSMAEWKFASSNFMLNFNPNNWLVGLKISI